MANFDRFKLRNDRYIQEVDRYMVKIDRYKFLLILVSKKHCGPYTNRFRPDREPKIIVMNEMTIKVISGMVHA
jgi:hypothetical protein